MNPRQRVASMLVVTALTFSAGCGGSSSSGGKGGDGGGDGRSPAERVQRQNDLRQIGIAYHVYTDKNGKGPASAEALEPELDEKSRQRQMEMLKSGEIVFIYNVSLQQMFAEGTSNTVLAYEKIVPEKGGYVLMGDASVNKMSADEFKKATLAKPKDK